MSHDIASLQRRFARPGAIAFEVSPLGGAVVELTAPGGRAIVALQGAQVLSFTPTGASDLLWLSSASRLGTGKAVRGGIPVCWPWFGPHPADPALPAHGFVRTRAWAVVATAAAGGIATLTLETSVARDGPNAFPGWPYAARVRLTVGVSTHLDVALTTLNTGPVEIALTDALHTYLAVGDVEDVAVGGLEDGAYIDKLTADAPRRQDGPVAIAAEVDRIYVGTRGPIAVVDRRIGRRIVVERRGSDSAVVWNPWVAKAARLGDIVDDAGEDAWRRLLCIEATNAGPDVVRVPPGGTHTLATRIGLADA